MDFLLHPVQDLCNKDASFSRSNTATGTVKVFIEDQLPMAATAIVATNLPQSGTFREKEMLHQDL
jgi:hypothetical protein